ncbi:CaiB/BaiF CoA transferase family protein [Arachidicoccus sp.]|uniref:CaiB/BaiF CoA transferase family protein n=1 Tax=Arachidicoccus sp. TaxID=1872624 RepID=UPI003D1F43CC
MKPLENLIVLEFCQYMSGPSAGLRLADLGARVIKIERPDGGDNGRQLAVKDLFIEGNSILFHTINRNKESYVADLKNVVDLEKVKILISKADVLIHNFRPKVMEKLGLGFEEIQELNDKLIYAQISGYGKKGPWKKKPGQDLLLQSISGLTWLSGDRTAPPIPFGLSIADYMCGTHLTQGILAALIKRNKTKTGSLVEVNLLSSLIDFQFEVITTFLNDGGKLPERAAKGNAHAYLSAPYGIYKTLDGYLVVAMENLEYLGKNIDLIEIKNFVKENFSQRDIVMEMLQSHFQQKPTKHWLLLLESAKIWCAGVLNYQQFLNHNGFKVLNMTQEIELSNNKKITTTRCPIRIDGERYFSKKPGPLLGENNIAINQEMIL